MKYKKTLFTKVFILSIFLISCNSSNIVETEILDFKRDNVNYKVFEHPSKLNSNNIDQCDSFLEYENTENGFELHGASIADVYSNFFDLDRNQVQLEDKEPIFYSVIYNGKKNEEIVKNIAKKLLNRRGLDVIVEKKSVNINVLSSLNLKKIEHHESQNQLESSKVNFSDNEIVLHNTSISMLIQILNERYSNEFYYNGNNSVRYNFIIPLNQTKEELLIFLNNKFGIIFKKEIKEIDYYKIIKKID